MKTSISQFLIRITNILLIFSILFSNSTPSKISAANNDLSNPFDSCECVNFAFNYAPTNIQRLIKWTRGTRFDGYPNPLSWTSWYAGSWATNVKTYGSQMDPNLDWVGAVNHTPEIGAIVVYAYGTLHEYGHVAVVTDINLAANTINTKDKNIIKCKESTRKNVQITSSMLFIHDPMPLPSSNNGGTNQYTEKTLTTNFYSKMPFRKIWVKTASKFELRIDGQLINSQDRPQNWTTFFNDHYYLTPFKNHFVELKWWTNGSDPDPLFEQTWWPSPVVNAAEPDPESLLSVEYTYLLNPTQIAQGDPVSLTASAIAYAGYTVETIDVYTGENRIATINGSMGTISIPTENLAIGQNQLKLIANISNWDGNVAEAYANLEILAGQGTTITQQPPILNLQPPSLTSPSNGVTLSQTTAVDLDWNEVTGATEYKVEVWGGPYSLMTMCDWQSKSNCPIGVMWPGTMSWHVKARNSSGKESEWSDTWTFTVQGGTQTPTVQACSLAIEDLSITPGSATVGSTISIHAKSNWNNCFRAMRLKIDGSIVYEVGSPEFTYSWNTSGFSAGNHTIRVEVATQNDTSWSNPVVRENSYSLQTGATATPIPCQAPSIEDLSFNPGSASVGSSINIHAKSAWNNCFRAMRLKIDGSIVYELGSPEFNYTWNTNGYNSGEHSIQLEVAASGDNSWSNPSVRSSSFNLSAPSSGGSLDKPGLSSPSNGALLPPGTNITLQWNSVSGASQYLIEIWGGSYGGSHATPCGWVSGTSCNLGTIGAGNVLWRVKARDSSGNESPWSDEWNFTPQ